jgi:hypothetical protein
MPYPHRRPQRTYWALVCWSMLGLALPASCFGVEAAESPGELKAEFKNPPAEFRPLIITHGRALVDPNTLGWLAERRAGGTVLDCSVATKTREGQEPHTNASYLNDPQLFARLRKVVNKLKQQGSEIWIYDELAYPSASAGGRVLDGHPEYQVWAVSCRTFDPAGDQIRIEMEHPQVVSCVALPYRDGVLSLDHAVELTQRVSNNSLSWQPPNGDWRILVFERYQPDTWKRHNIPRRIVNIMDRRAIRRFIELTHARYAKELGPQLKDITLFFTDEPQFAATEPWIYGDKNAAPAVQWCDELPSLFRKKKGYDVTHALPALFHDVGPKTSHYRFDFYDVQSDLVAENYFGQIQDWCHQHGVWSSGHMLLEESLLFHVMWSGSMVKNWSRMDLPGVDLLGLPRYKTMGGWNGNSVIVDEDFSCKMAASIAHLNQKPGVFTESYAVAQEASLAAVRGIAAWQFACGITHMSTYTIQQQLPADQFAQFSDFVGRMAIFCRRGKPVANVAVLVPEASVWAAYHPPDGGLFPRYLSCNPDATQIDHVFRETVHCLLSNQRGFEIMSEDLWQQAAVQDGRLRLADLEFDFVVLPETRMLHAATISKLDQFLGQGGGAVFVGTLPHQDPAVGMSPHIRQQIQRLIAKHSGQATHVKDVAQLHDALNWMSDRMVPSLTWQGPSTARLLHRREPDREIVLVANPSSQNIQGQLSSEIAGVTTLWNPETGDAEVLGPRDKRAPINVGVPADSARILTISTCTD